MVEECSSSSVLKIQENRIEVQEEVEELLGEGEEVEEVESHLEEEVEEVEQDPLLKVQEQKEHQAFQEYEKVLQEQLFPSGEEYIKEAYLLCVLIHIQCLC